VEKIVSKEDQHEVSLDGVDDSTPARIRLSPGAYVVTLSGENGTQNVDVQIEANKPTTKHVRMNDVNIDQLTQEVTRKP
jgi:hypothetical protein